ncbi:MAG TPA: hypothetical protein VHK88_04455 [Aquihabitans sp.]|jgi:hypothetical protein|nr:hypothetical protein [Aquihabitans sp.]
MTARNPQGTTRGAYATRPPRKSPLGWIVPVGLLLLLALAALVALILLNANDEGDDPGVDIQDDPQAVQVWEPGIAA